MLTPAFVLVALTLAAPSAAPLGIVIFVENSPLALAFVLGRTVLTPLASVNVNLIVSSGT